jgi:hypothetical protein
VRRLRGMLARRVDSEGTISILQTVLFEESISLS